MESFPDLTSTVIRSRFHPCDLHEGTDHHRSRGRLSGWWFIRDSLDVTSWYVCLCLALGLTRSWGPNLQLPFPSSMPSFPAPSHPSSCSPHWLLSRSAWDSVVHSWCFVTQPSTTCAAVVIVPPLQGHLPVFPRYWCIWFSRSYQLLGFLTYKPLSGLCAKIVMSRLFSSSTIRRADPVQIFFGA